MHTKSKTDRGVRNDRRIPEHVLQRPFSMPGMESSGFITTKRGISFAFYGTVKKRSPAVPDRHFVEAFRRMGCLR